MSPDWRGEYRILRKPLCYSRTGGEPELGQWQQECQEGMLKSIDMAMIWSQTMLERKGTVDGECVYFVD